MQGWSGSGTQTNANSKNLTSFVSSAKLNPLLCFSASIRSIIGVDYGGDGGDMSPPLFKIRILSPPLFRMCKPIATEKIHTHSTEIVGSKSCDRRKGEGEGEEGERVLSVHSVIIEKFQDTQPKLTFLFRK